MLESLLLLPAVLIGGATAQNFVTTNGGGFSVDGKNFRFAGSNAYYWPFGNVCHKHEPGRNFWL